MGYITRLRGSHASRTASRTSKLPLHEQRTASRIYPASGSWFVVISRSFMSASRRMEERFLFSLRRRNSTTGALRHSEQMTRPRGACRAVCRGFSPIRCPIRLPSFQECSSSSTRVDSCIANFSLMGGTFPRIPLRRGWAIQPRIGKATRWLSPARASTARHGWIRTATRRATPLKSLSASERLDFGHMQVQITIDDVKMCTRPWTATLRLELIRIRS